ncbi:hypothetical protein [Streptomyces sp. NPDC001388]|uniref:hypothetical protein n=1 Tax=Streptomyces sp. NPDC001388 TaxID=3364568 RepID=UPI00369A340D
MPEIRAVRYVRGAWMDPHTDRADKLVTRTWYFNDPWPPTNHGQFLVLRSPDVDDVETEVLPPVGESIVLCPSDRSCTPSHPWRAEAADDRKVSARRKAETRLVTQAETPLERARLTAIGSRSGAEDRSFDQARAALLAVTPAWVAEAAARLRGNLAVAVRPEAA